MTNILLIFSMVSCLGFNTPSSDVTPLKKIFFITKVPVKVQLPPCTIVVTVYGNGRVTCPGSALSFPWAASGSCKIISYKSCDEANRLARNCAFTALLNNSITAQFAAFERCPL